MTTGTLSQFLDYEGSLTATAHAMKTSFLSSGSVCQQVYQKLFLIRKQFFKNSNWARYVHVFCNN